MSSNILTDSLEIYFNSHNLNYNDSHYLINTLNVNMLVRRESRCACGRRTSCYLLVVETEGPLLSRCDWLKC